MSVGKGLTCFKAYDVRGKLGQELNEEIAYQIACAAAHSLGASTVALGFDARATSPALARAAIKGICESGADVFDIGLAGTEEIYAAVSEFSCDMGIEITASHNPIDYNGMKFVKKGSQPLSSREFAKIRNLAQQSKFTPSACTGLIKDISSSAREAYIKKILRFVDLPSLKPLKIVINSGNGAGGPTIDALNKKLKIKGVKTNFVFLHHKPDSSFPNGIPNPMLEKNRLSTARAVVREKADFGVAFDGDFDRCFLFDHKGNFIPGEYIVGLLSEIFLKREKGATIVHDPRVVWNTTDIVSKYGGHVFCSKTGHAFVKAAMRDTGAIYGGEISAHHYFRDFAYCDSGMVPWLIVWELLSKSSTSLFDLISKRKNDFPSSGELNFKVSDPENCIEKIKQVFASEVKFIDHLDGLSMSFEKWRFNLRRSNTEPLVRLNVETSGDQLLLKEKTEILKQLIKNA